MKRVRTTVLAFLIGALLVRIVPVLLALVAAAPGLATLTRSIRSAGLPLAPTFFALTSFLPTMLLSFAVGLKIFRALKGSRVGLLLASAAPWLSYSLYVHVDLCAGSPVSCTGAYDVAGLADVPLGLLLAAFVSRPPGLDLSLATDPPQELIPSSSR